MSIDIGLTHVALAATDLDKSISFYRKYANMEAVHDRQDKISGDRVVWLSDLTRPFVIVLIQADSPEPVLRPFAHLGVGCQSKEEVDRLAALAKEEDLLVLGPKDEGPPVGYYIFVKDPDGHTLELAYGQDVFSAVEQFKTT